MKGTRPARLKSLRARIKADIAERNLREAAHKLDRGQCVYCGVRLKLNKDRDLRTLDHFVPVIHMINAMATVEQINHIDNLVTACITCNQAYGHELKKNPKFGRFKA